MRDLYLNLGLKKDEVKVFETLETEKRIFEIAKATKLPRSSVVEILKRFLKRRLIQQISWGNNNKQKYFSRINTSLLEIDDYQKIVVHRGQGEILKTWTISHKIKHIRSYVYVSNHTASKIFSKADLNFIINNNNVIRNNKQITEVFFEKGYIESVEKVLSKADFTRWLKSLNRTFVAFIVDKNTFYSRNDIFIFMDSLFIYDWSKEICIEIKQIETINIMKQLLENLKTSCRQINMNALIESYK